MTPPKTRREQLEGLKANLIQDDRNGQIPSAATGIDIGVLIGLAQTAIKDNEDWEQSFDLYDRASQNAVAYWQKATGSAHVIPDRAQMLDWFISERDRIQRELDAAVEHAGSLIKQRNDARAWAEKTVQEMAVVGRTVTCVYCGMEYGEGTPTSQDERLTAHISQCEKHPMRAIEEQARSLRDGIASQAQKVHQAYHETGTWEDCPKDVCASARTYLTPSHA